MPETRTQLKMTTVTALTRRQQRATAAAALADAVRLAKHFRPATARHTLTKRADGLYNEPYSAIVERGDEVSVLCVQRTRHRQVRVRYMPEREWERMIQHGEEVHPGKEGESSLHVVAPPEVSLLPREFLQQQQQQAAAEENAGHVDNTAAVLALGEPAVFDYFVARERRTEKNDHRNKSLVLTTLRLQVRYNKSELQRVAREDCRAMLSVERRSIFLRQYQRDMQSRMFGVSLYTVGTELPEQFVQTFFMAVENAQMLRRYQERLDAANGRSRTARATQLGNATATTTANNHQNHNNNGGRYLFTMDQVSANSGERLPFAGQAPADGFVVVTVGPSADAFSAGWQPWNVAGRFSWLSEDDVPFELYDYGSAEYIPCKNYCRVNTEDVEKSAERVAIPAADGGGYGRYLHCSSPLLPRYPERHPSRKISGIASNGSSGLVHLVPVKVPSSRWRVGSAEKLKAPRRCASMSGSHYNTEDRDGLSRSSSGLPLPLSSEEADDETTVDLTPRLSQESVVVL